MRSHLRPLLSVIVPLVLACSHGRASAQDALTITTFNIEHLGSPGRGFGGGFGAEDGPLAKRTDEQLKSLALLIKNELQSDVLALQEVAITSRRLGKSSSRPMEKIVSVLKDEGQNWHYYLPVIDHTPDPDDQHNEHLGFLWNRDRVRLLAVFEMDLVNQELAGKSLFDRMPLIGYFEAIRDDGKPGNDFVLVNVHMGSGQNFDENHLIAMTLIEFELAATLGRHAVTESDRIILGDFNDNPLIKNNDGRPKYSPALYEHMKFKGYVDLVTERNPHDPRQRGPQQPDRSHSGEQGGEETDRAGQGGRISVGWWDQRRGEAGPVAARV